MFEKLFEFFQNDEFLAGALFFFGTLFGSFANVIIIRLPEGENIAKPRSACRNCKALIPWYHNFPIISWLVLRGRCYKCKAKFSARYPLVEFIMGVVFAACGLRYGISWSLLESLMFVFALVCCTFIDFDHMILPDELTLSGIVLGLLGALLNPEREFLPSLYGVLLGGGFLWSVAYLYFVIRKREGMGGGDIKLIAWIGAVFGWTSIPIVIIGSSLLGAIVGIILVAGQKDAFKKAIPFGPYLVAAALGYMFFHGERIGQWYLQIHGLVD